MGTSDDDTELWKSVTKDVKRLPGRQRKAVRPQAPVLRKIVKNQYIKPKNPDRPAPRVRTLKSTDMDSSTERKFRRGQMAIEARTDLHGMNREDAYERLAGFIKRSHRAGKRCVLVITGKGSAGRPGILRQLVPEWLAEPAFNAMVLKISPARVKDGGAGALYILLRRDRQL